MLFKDNIFIIKKLPDEQINAFIEKRIEYMTKKCQTSVLGYNMSAISINSYEGFIVPHKQKISLDWTYGRTFKVDDLETMYKMIIEQIKETDPKNFKEIFKSVATVVYDYVGGALVEGTMEDRFKHIILDDEFEDANAYNLLSSIKGSKHAYCVERSIIAQEIFTFLGLNSRVVFSPVTINGNKEIHCFNIIKEENKSYIIDTSLIDCATTETVYNPIAFEGETEQGLNLRNIPTRKTISSRGEVVEIIYNPENLNVRNITIAKETISQK